MRHLSILLLFLAGCPEPEPDTGGITVDADNDGWDASEDCDDDDASVNPGAAEVCNDIDDDCDGDVDEDAVDAPTWYPDDDDDGYGVDEGAVTACEQPAGFAAEPGDCDDADASINPGAAEACNGVDDDCDGEIDEDVQDVWYADDDGDGFGDPASPVEDCDPGPGFVANADDCDDTDAQVYPGAPERCNDLDDDCDGETDEDPVDAPTWYVDDDGDGYGEAGDTVMACDRPEGTAAEAGDCDDTDPGVNPGAEEIRNGVDDDCDGEVDEDLHAGTGRDGPLTVSGATNLSTSASGTRTSPDAIAFAVSAISGDTITVDGTVVGLAAGDEVLLINLQGTADANAAAGTYEFATVASTAGADVVLAGPVAGVYGEIDNTDLTGQVVVLQRVPHYTTVTVAASGQLIASPWTGRLGGVLAFRASERVQVAPGGTVTMSTRGFTGGDTGEASDFDGFQGESYGGLGVGNVQAKPYNLSIDGYLPNLGGGGALVTGGGGNHGGGATAGDSWDGGTAPAPQPGETYGVADLSMLFMGSGGGGVWNGGLGDPGEDPGPGGAGGGIVYVGSARIVAEDAAAFAASGETTIHWSDGYWTYGAGGGAGGSVWLVADEVDLATGAVQALGGLGEDDHVRAGGDGGDGRIRIDCATCNGFAAGTDDAATALDDAAQPDPGHVATP